MMLTYISWSSDFILYLQHYFMDLHNTSDIGSVWNCEWPHNTSRSKRSIFHGTVISLNISNTIWWIYIILGILVQNDSMGDLIILIDHYDLYFMVQWFCLISPTLFDGFTTYLGYCFNVTLWVTSSYLQVIMIHGSVILLNSSNTIWWIYIILWILVQYDTMSELIVLIGQCDLYFMVQWY